MSARNSHERWDSYWYSNPEKVGLRAIGELDDPQACYSFNILAVWQHDDGRVFWGVDAGCSCPAPFEDTESLDDLTLLTADTWAEFQEAVERHCVPYEYDHSVRPPVRIEHPESDPQAADKTQLLAKVSPLVPRNDGES